MCFISVLVCGVSRYVSICRQLLIRSDQTVKRVVANLNSSFDSGEHRSCRERNTSDFQFNLDELVVDL